MLYKGYTISVIVLFFLLIGFDVCSCKAQNSKEADPSNYISYLDVDSIYKSSIEKQKFNQLKREFLKTWLDTGNCFTKRFRLKSGRPLSDTISLKKIFGVEIDNILHTPHYDTVIVIVAFDAAWVNEQGEKNGGELTYAQAMKAVIDVKGGWHFNCDFGSYWIMVSGNKMVEVGRNYRKILIEMGCLDKNNKVDQKFFNAFFTTDIPLPKGNNEVQPPESGPVK